MTSTTTQKQNIKNEELLISTPGVLRVIKREGHVVQFEPDRIRLAITNAFLATEGSNVAKSERIQAIATSLTQNITQRLETNWSDGGTLHIEAIQDMVELSLMRAGEHKVARHYVLYREERRKQRLKDNVSSKADDILITLDNGESETLDQQWLNNLSSQKHAQISVMSNRLLFYPTIETISSMELSASMFFKLW